jgi:hypothetical protein
MLFVIDSSLADPLRGPSRPSDALIDAVSNLALARREGKHVVFADRRTLTACVKSPWLSDRTRRVYDHLLNNLPQMKAYLDNLARRVEIVASDGVFELTTARQCRVIRVSASLLRDFSMFDASVLVCENLTDTRFYVHVAKACLHWWKLGNLILRYDPRGGGGQTTSDAYESVRSSRSRLCLCIVESDRTTPNDGLGRTALAAQEVDSSGVQPLCELVVLTARAVENIIPTRVYEEAVWGDTNRMAAVLVLERLELGQFAEARLHLDLKGGLRLGEILHAAHESAFRRYWEPVARGLQGAAHSVDRRCWSNPDCSVPDECHCIVAPGMGDTILEHVADFLDRKSNCKKAEMISGALKPEWERVGLIVVAWCCGASRLSAV